MYTDLLVEPREGIEALRIIKVARRMGYRVIGLREDKLESDKAKILGEASKLGVKVLNVVEVESSSELEAKKIVRRVYSNDKVLIGIPQTPSALRFFSRDTRVRVVEIPPRLTKLLDRNQAKLMLQGESLVGIRLSRLLKKVKLVPWLDKILSFSIRYGVDVIMYSGARDWSMLWHPKTIISLLSMMGYPRGFAKTVLNPCIVGCKH